MPPPVLSSRPQIAELVDVLSRQTVVGFDTEFHSERTYVPRLMLVQLSTREDTFVVDPLGEGDLSALFQALARPGLTVVGHALKNDLRIVYLHYGITMSSVFDTQTAAAFLGHGLQVGLSTLLHSVLGVHQPKGDQMSDWSQRPLPDRLVGYAAGDVQHLLRLYDLLTSELAQRDRQAWVDQECQELRDPAKYERDPAQAWQRVAGGRRMEPREAGVLHALAAERELMAAEEDQVPHFLLPDEMLLLMAKVAPRQRKDLEGDRRLSHRTVQRHAQRWIDAVLRGLEKPVARTSGRPPPPPELEAVAALLMLLVGDIASRNSIAQQLLVKRDTLLNALRDNPRSQAEFAAAAELHGWRADLLAAPLWDLLTSRMAVTCASDELQGIRMAFQTR
ncbi:MAG: ribonuclease D [Myxococcota bacterium]